MPAPERSYLLVCVATSVAAAQAERAGRLATQVLVPRPAAMAATLRRPQTRLPGRASSPMGGVTVENLLHYAWRVLPARLYRGDGAGQSGKWRLTQMRGNAAWEAGLAERDALTCWMGLARVRACAIRR